MSKRMKKFTCLIVSTALFCLIFTFELKAQKPGEPILKRFVTIDPLFNANIWSAVHALADQGIPIGFEARKYWNVDDGPRLLLKSGPLADVLNSISHLDPSYAWK